MAINETEKAELAMRVCRALHEYAHSFYEEIPKDLAKIVSDARAILGIPEVESDDDDDAYDDACEARSHGEACCPHCREELPRRSDEDAETTPTQVRCQCCGAWVDSPPAGTQSD